MLIPVVITTFTFQRKNTLFYEVFNPINTISTVWRERGQIPVSLNYVMYLKLLIELKNIT